MTLPSPQLTVADVLALDRLGLVVRAGKGALDNPIEVAYVSESPDTAAWLEGGEFLVTSGSMLGDTAEAWQEYVATIASRGAAALALGVGSDVPHDTMPEGLVAAAEKHRLPLLEIPDGVPYIAVTKAVFTARAAKDREVLEHSFELQRELTKVASRERGLTGLAQAWQKATGEQVVVLDRRARALATTAELPGDTTRQIAEAAGTLRPLAGGALSVTTDAGEALVGTIGATRHAGYLARFGSGAEIPHLAAPTLLSLLALEFERRWLLDEPQRRMRASQLNRLLTSDDEGRAAAQLKAIGIQAETLQALAIQARTEEQAEEVLADLTLALGTGLVRRRDLLVEAMAAHDPRPVLSALDLTVPVGIGGPAAPGLAARSMRQAHSALATSRRTGSAVEYVDGLSHEFLLTIADPDYLASFTDAVLAPIDRADNGTALVETLHAWLAEERSIAACSARLGVHRHTVRNRIQKVTQLLGRSVETVETQTELWLALKARGMREDG